MKDVASSQQSALNWSEHRSSAKGMGLANGTAPVAEYGSAQEFERERERIYRRSWLIVAREEDVAEPGDFVKLDIPTFDASIVLTRGKDGGLNAFHNACSHRGVALVTQECGNARTFRCPYHAWTYGLDGSLRAIPAEDDFPHVCKEDNGLTRLPLESWNGFIFLNFDDDPMPFAEFMAGMDTVFADMPFSDYPFVIAYSEEVSANWKLLVNAFNEGYHIPFLHSKTLVPQLVTADNPYLQYHDIRRFGPHSSSTLQRNYDWVPEGPAQEYAMQHMLPTSVPDKDAIAAGKAGLTQHPGVNAIGIANFGTEVITLFPNVILQPLANGFLLFTFWPTAADKMRVDVRVQSKAPPANLREEFAAANMLAATRDVLTEDITMSQMQQSGLKGVKDRNLYFGENEAHLRFFSKAVADFMAS